jgi:hypothetical protein
LVTPDLNKSIPDQQQPLHFAEEGRHEGKKDIQSLNINLASLNLNLPVSLLLAE